MSKKYADLFYISGLLDGLADGAASGVPTETVEAQLRRLSKIMYDEGRKSLAARNSIKEKGASDE